MMYTFLDFAKAFDTLDDAMLLVRLKKLGFRETHINYWKVISQIYIEK